jgi:hypothetical protein
MEGGAWKRKGFSMKMGRRSNGSWHGLFERAQEDKVGMKAKTLVFHDKHWQARCIANRKQHCPPTIEKISYSLLQIVALETYLHLDLDGLRDEHMYMCRMCEWSCGDGQLS